MRTRCITCIGLILLLFSLFAPAVLAEGTPPLAVYYAGPEGGVRTALALAADIRLVSDPAQAERPGPQRRHSRPGGAGGPRPGGGGPGAHPGPGPDRR
jgi:hypothetical protein